MMGRVSINREQDADSTAVSNIFIDEYMTEANDAQLKIYLYLLRMMRSDKPTSLSDLAERFNLTEKDVTRALKFWEKRGIITMEFDRNKKLSAIHLEEFDAPVHPAHETAPEPVLPESSQTVISAQPLRRQATTAPAAAPVMPADDQSWQQILFIAEQYIGRPLSVTEINSLLFIRDTLCFSDALTEYLLQYCVDRGKKDFRYIERVAVSWKENGYETPEQARRGSFKYDKKIYEVMEMLGLTNVPTTTEASFVERWISEYKMGMEVIREACSRTVLATQKHRMEYADKILLSWHEAGVTKKSDIKQLDSAYEESKKTRVNAAAGSAASRSSSSGRKQNYPQRSWDFSQMEKNLIKN